MNYPAEAYVIEGTYCPDRSSAITQAAVAARCEVKGMLGTAASEAYAVQLLDAANKSPLTEVRLRIDGMQFGKGSNPGGSLSGSVRAMRVRWDMCAIAPAPSA